MATREHIASLARKTYEQYKQTGDRKHLVRAKRLLATIKEMDAQDPETFRAGLLRAVENIPGSGAQFLEDITAPLHSPIQTAKGLKDLAVGLYEKMTPGLQPEETNVDALVDFFKDRYGSFDATMRTLREDPVGFLGDISTVLGVGAAAAPGKAGAALTKAAAATDPVAATVSGAGKLVAQLTPESMPHSMYTKAAKFGTTLGDEARARLVQSALDEQLMPTSEGLAQAYTRADVLSARVGELIDDAVKRGDVRIHRRKLFGALDKLRKEKGGVKLYGRQNLEAIDQIEADFRQQLMDEGKVYLTPREVQDFKLNTQAIVNYGRKNLRNQPIAEATEEAFARGARESLEEVIPEVADVNQRLSRIRDLVGRPRDPGPLAKVAARIDQRNVAGLGLPMDILAGGEMLPGGVGGAIGAVKGIMELPKVRSSMALDLYRMKHPELDLPARYRSRTRRLVDEFATNPVLHGIMFQSGRYGEDIAP